MKAALLLAAGLALAAGPVSACRLALALALDVSSSVDDAEYRLQAEGLAAALTDAEVMEAILAPGDPVAIAVYEWSGRRQHVVTAPWTLLRGPEDIVALADRLGAARRTHADFPTALGHALGFAARLFLSAPACDRRTVDVSGDGANNDGYEPVNAYNAFDLDDVTVNALVVGGVGRPSLVRYFQTLVIKGEDSFTELAEDYADFGRAMRRKLIREVRPPMILGAAGPHPPPRPLR
ncbi:MAG TPA: DUF1194 domain-containing protein [Paracoccaceae bacterium]|nr:DUF1194 domain-containing protein [Paracoccaceae bacterium]